jgi:hypothetical protein
MSIPAWRCVPRSSPKLPVRTPRTGVTVEHSPPSAATGAAGFGAGAASDRRSRSSFRVARFDGPPRFGTSDAAGVTPGAAARFTIAGAARSKSAASAFGASRRNSTRDRKIAAHVAASTTPVGASPCAAWNLRTARSVIGPKMPSSSTPTRRWTCATAPPTLPRSSSAAPAWDRPSSTAPDVG